MSEEKDLDDCIENLKCNSAIKTILLNTLNEITSKKGRVALDEMDRKCLLDNFQSVGSDEYRLALLNKLHEKEELNHYKKFLLYLEFYFFQERACDKLLENFPVTNSSKGKKLVFSHATRIKNRMEHLKKSEKLPEDTLFFFNVLLKHLTDLLHDTNPVKVVDYQLLHTVSQNVPGKESLAWKNFGIALMVFGMTAFIVSLMISPIDGGGIDFLLINAGMEIIYGIMAASTAVGLTGFGLFKSNSQRGLAKEVSEFEALLEEDEDVKLGDLKEIVAVKA